LYQNNQIVKKTEKSEIDFAFRNMFEDPGESGILLAKRTRVSLTVKRHTNPDNWRWHAVAYFY